MSFLLFCLFIYYSILTVFAEVQTTLKPRRGGSGDDEGWEDGECSTQFPNNSTTSLLTVTSGIQGRGAVQMFESLERGSNVTTGTYTAGLQNGPDRIGQSRIQGTES